MRSRSESVKRTVVDLSFSFFIAPDSLNWPMGLSLRWSNQRQLGDSSPIPKRYHPTKYLSGQSYCNLDGDVRYLLPPA